MNINGVAAICRCSRFPSVFMRPVVVAAAAVALEVARTHLDATVRSSEHPLIAIDRL